MRTRRSPKNQQRLWKELGGTSEKVTPVKMNLCFDCVYYPKGGRARGECTLIGNIIRGSNKDRPCFEARL